MSIRNSVRAQPCGVFKTLKPRKTVHYVADTKNGRMKMNDWQWGMYSRALLLNYAYYVADTRQKGGEEGGDLLRGGYYVGVSLR